MMVGGSCLRNVNSKSSFVFWSSCVVALAILICGLIFLGKPIQEEAAINALPIPEEGKSYVLYVEEGSTLLRIKEAVAVDRLLSLVLSIKEADFKAIDMFLSMIEGSKDTACLVLPSEGKFYLAIKPDSEILHLIASGKLPAKWLEAYPEVTHEVVDGMMRVDISQSNSLWILPYRDLLLVSSSMDDLGLMKSNLDNEGDVSSFQWLVQGEWSGRLRCHVETNIDGELAWICDDEKLSAKWKIQDIEGLLSKEEISLPSPQKWSGNYALPSRRSLTIGLTMIDTPQLTKGVSSLASALGVNPDKLLEFLRGQVIFSLGGEANIFTFHLPGVLFQFPNRGDLGKEIVDDIWENRLQSLLINRGPLEGFESGGVIEIPVSLVLASSEDMTLLGLASTDTLSNGLALEKALPAVAGRDYMFWADVDFGSIAGDMEKLIAVSRTFGSEVPARIDAQGNFDKLYKVVKALKDAGHLFVGLQSITDGELLWEYKSSHTGD